MDRPIWLLRGRPAVLDESDQVRPGDLVMCREGEMVLFGRVGPDRQLTWFHEVPEGSLPDRERLREAAERYGPVQPVEHAPRLAALVRSAEAGRAAEDA
jgi:hypothetical protein